MACNKLPKLLLIAALFSTQLVQINGANILFFIAMGGPSHTLAIEPLAKALDAKGHNITILSIVNKSSPDSKINYYSPKNNFFKTRKELDTFWLRSSGLSRIMIFGLQHIGVKLCEGLYEDPEFVDFVRQNKFDLLIIDSLANECAYGIAEAHQAKKIIFSVSTILNTVSEGIGIPDETNYIPDVMLGFPPDMNFFQRIAVTLVPVILKGIRHFYYFPKLTSITSAALGKEIRSFEELESEIDLVFVNTHPAQEYPRSLPPNVIPVGGVTLVGKEKRPVPQKFEDFINKGKEGFIYVSFGSYFDFLDFPQETQQRFINTLGRFPHIQFIWKLNKVLENLPKNVMVEKWLPQQELLAHPKIRTFITHAGIGGVNEAIQGSVPLILFPLFAEQDYNAYLAEKKGFGIKMEITSLKEGDFELAINKMLTDESYKENAKIVNSRFLDRQVPPLESALWWIEFTLRHDTSFLRSQNVNHNWWKKRQLDVWLFVLLTVILLNSLSVVIGYKIFKRCFGKKTKQVKKQKQN